MFDNQRNKFTLPFRRFMYYLSNMKFKEKIHKSIQRQGFTLDEASKIIGIDRITLYRWMKFPANITASSITSFSLVTGLSEMTIIRLINKAVPAKRAKGGEANA